MSDYRGMIVPSAEADWSEVTTDVELSRQQQGKLFKKHILTKGILRYKKRGQAAQIVDINDAFIATLTKNFKDRVVDIVQVPIAGPHNEHTEDPLRNIGEVIDLTEENGKVYAYIDVRDEIAATKLGKTLLGASALVDLDAINTDTLEKVGPALVHTCVTNNPYVTKLEEYKEIVAASSDSIDNVAVFSATNEPDAEPDAEPKVVVIEDTVEVPVAPKTEEPAMPEEKPVETTQDALLAELRDKHGIDVAALQELAKEVEGLKAQLVENDKPADVTPVEPEELKAKDELIAQLEEKVAASAQSEALTAALTKALTEVGALSLSNSDEEETLTLEDAVNGVSELAEKVVTLSSSIEALELTNQRLERDRAVQEIEGYVREGKILPAKREAQLKLRLTDSDTFYELLPSEPIVKLSNEEGFTPNKDDGEKLEVETEVARVMTNSAFSKYFTK